MSGLNSEIKMWFISFLFFFSGPRVYQYFNDVHSAHCNIIIYLHVKAYLNSFTGMHEHLFQLVSSLI